jgi:hypothetical protein
MIEIEIKGDGKRDALAELIASTLHGHVVDDPRTDLVLAGKLVRREQEDAEQRRPSQHDIETVNFKLIDDDQDWSDI